MMRTRAASLGITLSLLLGTLLLLTPSAVAEDGTTRIPVATLPEYTGGYGYDSTTQTMTDTNGFEYSYQPDGLMLVTLPWGYETYFSWGMTGTYLASPVQRTALDYDWTWKVDCYEVWNNYTDETTDEHIESVAGYDYDFVAENADSALDWTITFSFSYASRMKVTHEVTNGYDEPVQNVEFWYLFDLRGTATPYTIETTLGTVNGPLYQEIPESVSWVRLSNQFQFSWRDIEYPNGHAYIGDGDIIGYDGIPILGISVLVGDISPSQTVTLDPYFSGVEKTWNAGAAGDASVAGNWDPVGVPDTGDNITFDGTSTYDCDWDVEVTLGDFSMLTGYTGTVTQSVGFGIADLTIQSGILCGSRTQFLICYGNISHSGGTIQYNYLTIDIAGIDVSIATTEAPMIYSFKVTGSVTITTSFHVGFELEINGTVTIGSTRTLTFFGLLYGGTFSNTGTIDGTGKLLYLLVSSKIVTFGAINCPVQLQLIASATSDRNLNIGDDTSFGSTLEIYSDHTTYTLTFEHGANYTLSVTGAVTLDDRAIMTQGTEAWSFGSYTQSGTDSAFNQGATVTIGGNFTVSDGTFNAIGDMTVPGSWDTATGEYVNDDNVVTLTGTGTLAMNSSDSFYNITIGADAHVTMNTDTTVDCRATILGEMLGTGDFIEPEPEFTSTPETTLYVGEVWEYTPTQTYWDALDYDELPGWAVFDGSTFRAMPNATGFYDLSITLTWNDMVTYQNVTLLVEDQRVTESVDLVLETVLAVIFGFGLMIAGFIWHNPVLILFSGLIWLASALLTFANIDELWMLICLGLGTVLLLDGGLNIAEGYDDK